MKRCPSFDVLVDLVMDDLPASSDVATHAWACPRCGAELRALRAVVRALDVARSEPVPEEWTERILARVRETEASVSAVAAPAGVVHSVRTLVLASVTVLAAVLLFAPGGAGSPTGLFAYSLAAGVVAAGMEALRDRKPGRWRAG